MGPPRACHCDSATAHEAQRSKQPFARRNYATFTMPRAEHSSKRRCVCKQTRLTNPLTSIRTYPRKNRPDGLVIESQALRSNISELVDSIQVEEAKAEQLRKRIAASTGDTLDRQEELLRQLNKEVKQYSRWRYTCFLHHSGRAIA